MTGCLWPLLSANNYSVNNYIITLFYFTSLGWFVDAAQSGFWGFTFETRRGSVYKSSGVKNNPLSSLKVFSIPVTNQVSWKTMKYYLELNLKYYHLKARKEDDGKVSNILHWKSNDKNRYCLSLNYGGPQMCKNDYWPDIEEN